jgi:cytochrome P450
MMRRTTTEQTEIAGVEIPAGEKIVMWYLSGNRDERMITDPDQFVINRENPRRHLSFGFGIHRCVGNRLAEMQLRVLWEEILLRKHDIEIVGAAERTLSHVVRGFAHLPVRVN